MKQGKQWVGTVKSMRLPFLTGSMAPAAVAGAYGWSTGVFDWPPFLVAALGVACLQIAANLINDYYDAPGTDEVNFRFTPFSGGSRVIQERLLSRDAVKALGLGFFSGAILTGLTLAVWRTPGVLWVGLLGLAAGWLYSIRPVELMSRGLGELTIFLAFGPFLTMGMDYVLACELRWAAFWLGFPCGFLITAVIWINEFPDYEADRDTGKRNLVVLLGLSRSRVVYAGLMLLPYPVILLLSLLPPYSPWLLIALAAFPLSKKAVRLLSGRWEDRREIAEVQALTIRTHMAVGILMTVGFCMDALL
jgi:1,4-dihydroxy-2-naphthoate octaprenyltransferase